MYLGSKNRNALRPKNPNLQFCSYLVFDAATKKFQRWFLNKDLLLGQIFFLFRFLQAPI